MKKKQLILSRFTKLRATLCTRISLYLFNLNLCCKQYLLFLKYICSFPATLTLIIVDPEKYSRNFIWINKWKWWYTNRVCKILGNKRRQLMNLTGLQFQISFWQELVWRRNNLRTFKMKPSTIALVLAIAFVPCSYGKPPGISFS